MGEEEKKPEEKKTEEKKEEEKKAEGEKPQGDEKKAEEEESKDAPPPPPPPEIVLKVYMHCEGCARKVRRCLKGFQGVEDVVTDCKSHKVVVKGEKADPLKVLERVQRKSHRQVELLSPLPKPPAADEPKKDDDKDKPKPEEKKEEPPPVITVVLKVHMHCEACAQEIKKRIQRMKGVESADPDLKSSQVAVKGVFDPAKLVEYVYKRTGKHAVIVKQDPPPEKKEDPNKGKDGKEEKAPDGEAAAAVAAEEKKPAEEAEGDPKADKDGAAGDAPPELAGDAAAPLMMDLKKHEHYYYIPPMYARELTAYPPQIFSDENPNACSVM